MCPHGRRSASSMALIGNCARVTIVFVMHSDVAKRIYCTVARLISVIPMGTRGLRCLVLFAMLLVTAKASWLDDVYEYCTNDEYDAL